MPDEKKGITVKIDAALHAEVREYLESHGMTMAEFVSQALDIELHPKFQMKEMQMMANTRTIAFQVPEELYQRIKDYLTRNNMTQKQFFLGLVETELEREQQAVNAAALEAQDADTPGESENYTEDVPDAPAHNEDSPDQDEAPAYDGADSPDIGLSM